MGGGPADLRVGCCGRARPGHRLRYGGAIWARCIIALGEVAKTQGKDAPKPRRVQHKVSEAKRAREEAKRMQKLSED